jgi:hypothetical protein
MGGPQEPGEFFLSDFEFLEEGFDDPGPHGLVRPGGSSSPIFHTSQKSVKRSLAPLMTLARLRTEIGLS